MRSYGIVRSMDLISDGFDIRIVRAHCMRPRFVRLQTNQLRTQLHYLGLALRLDVAEVLLDRID
jgi:hypothetical protein